MSGEIHRLVGGGIPDSTQQIGKKPAAQPQAPTNAPSTSTPAAPVDTKSINAPPAADLAPVIARFSQPQPVSGVGNVATRTMSVIDPVKEMAKKLLDQLKSMAPDSFPRGRGDGLQDGLMNTR